MRRAAILLVVLATALLTVPAVAIGRPASDATAVAAVIKQQNAAFNAGQWKALWALYGPRFKARCNYARWVASTRKARAAIAPGKVRTTVKNVRVSGSRAYVSYDIFFAGHRVHADGDLYVKVRGQWRDEFDANTPCS